MYSIVRQTKADQAFDLINTIILSVCLLVTVYPLVFVLSASISEPLAVLNGEVWLLPKGIDFESYFRVFQNNDIIIGYKNTILYTVLGTLINLVMTTAGAYPLSRKDFRGRNFLMMLFTFTMFFSGGMIPTYILVKNLHLYNSMWAIIIPGAVSMYNLIIMRTYFMTTIPLELQEAASIDGSSNIGILIRVVLPLSKPIIAVMVMFYAVSHWNSYFSALIYLRDKEKYPLQLILREILLSQDMNSMLSGDTDTIVRQQMLAESLKYSIVVVASLPVLLLYPFLQKYFIKGVMVGAIKG